MRVVFAVLRGGLYYFNARWYDATTGRFTTEDPIQDGLNWYVYAANNPLKFIDNTGLEKEFAEQLGRNIAFGSSGIETIIGIILIIIPEPATTAAGIAMTVHGGINSLAAGTSLVAYEVTDGNTEFSTSAIGIATQATTYFVMISKGEDIQVAKDRSSLYGSAGDIGDAILSFFIPGPKTEFISDLSKINSFINIIGDIELAGTTAIDIVEYAMTNPNAPSTYLTPDGEYNIEIIEVNPVDIEINDQDLFFLPIQENNE